jgi:hypothetical protein
MDYRIKPGNGGGRASDMRHRPYSLVGPGQALVGLQFRCSPKTEGARDALDPVGPTDLDASRHRGMLKS